MKKISTVLLLTVAIISLMAVTCHRDKKDGLNFEKIYKEDIEKVTKKYNTEDVQLYAVYGCLNKAFEEIIDENIDINEIYFTDIYTIFQVGDKIVQLSHNGIFDTINEYEDSYWADSYKINIPDNIITADSALKNYLAQSDTVVPGNIIVLRSPFEMNDSLNCYYLFGYDSVYTIMNAKGAIVK